MVRARARAPGRSYRQYCAVARGLDLVGERWTLLIVRDLLTGPKRYTDLLAGLPGIGTNLLATRLRELEERGLVLRRVLPPPAGSSVYELTESGQALEPVIMALGRWGSRFLGPRGDTEFLSANAYLLAMRAGFRPETATRARHTYELRVAQQVFTVSVDDGRCATREGQPAAADAVLTMDVSTLGALLGGELSADEALATRQVTLAGDPTALHGFVQLFALSTTGAAPSRGCEQT
jgi:DNA-binding HxlR family transcriptional regulator/putative sterol carrier protein